MAHKVEDPPTTQETWVRSLSWDDPLEKGMSTHCILSGESHGQGSLAGYSPWGCKESDTTVTRASLVAQTVKSLPTMWETQVQSLGWKDPLEKEMATHSSTLAWKIPLAEEPGRLQSMVSQRVRHFISCY